MGIIENIILKLNNQQHNRMEVITTAVVIFSAYTLYQQWISKKNENDNCPIVPYHNFFYGSTLEYLENEQACLEKWSKFGPVYRVYLFGRLNTVISGTYVQEIGKSDNFTRVEGTYREFYLRQWTGISNKEFCMSQVREATNIYLALKLNSYASRITKYSDTGLNEALEDMAVVKVAASIFAGVVLCKDEKLIESFKCFGSAIAVARIQLANSMKPEIDSRLRGMSGEDLNWTRPTDILQDLIENYPQPVEKQPKLIDELINEQNEVFGDLVFEDDIKNYLTSVESIRKLVELDSVCRESFRANNDITASDRTNSGSDNVILSNGVIIPPVIPSLYYTLNLH
ncbi:hypothetical protein INT45_013735 [Circinella minor]|uniref:Uncharacterized protein n=1 Tax=Circinella minor TaxID=1195481 RepID=A0A8H7VSN7_9FUNG|nr:hypothetical protein INT45_013735 [Circinella minor]